MSTVIAKNAQIGTSGTATDNFTIFQPATPDGTLRIGNGNTGITTSLLTLNSSGNLGLGVAPSAWTSSFKALQIGAQSALSATSTGTFLSANWFTDGSNKYIGSGNATLYQQLNGQHVFYNAPSGTAGAAITFTQAMTLDASGNLGLGTTSPLAKAHIQDSTTAVQLFIKNSNGTLGSSSELVFGTWSGSIPTGSGNPGPQAKIVATVTNAGNTNTDLVFWTYGGGASAERARINSSGALKQQSGGASYEDTSLGYSEFNNGEVGTTALLQRCTNASFNGSVSVLKANRSANTGFNFIVAQANSVTQFSVRGDGNAFNTNNSYGALSDAKLKENVVDATPKLEKLNQVRIVNFNLIGSEQKQIGVIAQEVEQIFPGIVQETPDRDEEGNDLGTTTKAVKYSVFVPMLIKAIQEQQAIITALTARVAALESN